jgi:hypothetical protein
VLLGAFCLLFVWFTWILGAVSPLILFGVLRRGYYL